MERRLRKNKLTVLLVKEGVTFDRIFKTEYKRLELAKIIPNIEVYYEKSSIKVPKFLGDFF